jgi:hypothetical protein
MSQKLMSAEFYQEPSEDEVLADVKENLRSKSSPRLAKYFLNVAFWVTVVGGGALVVVGGIAYIMLHSATELELKPLDRTPSWMRNTGWTWNTPEEKRME